MELTSLCVHLYDDCMLLKCFTDFNIFKSQLLETALLFMSHNFNCVYSLRDKTLPKASK